MVTTAQPQNVPPTSIDIPSLLQEPPQGTRRGLRCNKCGEPICVRCAQAHAGWLSLPAVPQSQQAAFYTATCRLHRRRRDQPHPGDHRACFMAFLGWFFAIFLGPIAGGLIAEAVFRACGSRRGRWIGVTVVALPRARRRWSSPMPAHPVRFSSPALQAGNPTFWHDAVARPLQRDLSWSWLRGRLCPAALRPGQTCAAGPGGRPGPKGITLGRALPSARTGLWRSRLSEVASC